MITLLLIAVSVICVLVFRSIRTLLRRIPASNEDFDLALSAQAGDKAARVIKMPSWAAQYFGNEVVAARSRASAARADFTSA
jgi:hypothetical protein